MIDFFSQPTNVWFVVIAFLTLIASLGVVAGEKVMHLALYLGGSFAGVAALFVLLQSPFLAIAQVLIYVGAILVMILFGLMLTGAHATEPTGVETGKKVTVAAAVIVLTALTIWGVYGSAGRWPVVPSGLDTSLKALGQALYGHWGVAFEAASTLLLAALVGAIVVSRREDDEA